MNRLVPVVAALVMLGACKRKVPPTAPPARGDVTESAPAPLPLNEAVSRMVDNFSRVHFAFDSSTLDDDSKQALERNVRHMQNHPRVRVEVQGHADERGTTDYNVALGDRRARAVRDHMVLLGVSAKRVTTVSFGEEAPIDRTYGEQAWSKNRRAEFRVLVGDDGLSGTVR